MRPTRSVCVFALIPLFALALAPAAGAQQAVPPYNVTLLKVINDYPGVNDCWGYTGNGVELAIYGHQVGTSFVDATDPVNAVEIWNLPGPSSTWRDIKTYQQYAYIVTEGGGAGTGLQIVDLSDPLGPVHVATYLDDNFTSAHNLWIDEGAGVAYACGASPGGGMHILSLADPENPVELDFFTSYYIHDLWVGNGRGYAGAISSNSLRIMDVTNPASPFTLASHFYNGANTHNAWPIAGGTHVMSSDEVGGGHLRIWDISNLSNITNTSSYRLPDQSAAIIHNVLARNDMAYVSWYTGGARVIDVTDPEFPVEIGYYDTSSRPGGFAGCWGVYPNRPGNVFYASDRQEGLHILRLDGDYAGGISGTIRSAETTAPLDSAHVRILGTFFEFSTGGDGAYTGQISGATYDVETTRFGFAPDTASVTIPPHGAVVHDVDLSPIPNGTVNLDLTTLGGSAISGVRAEVLDSPIVGLESDGAGRISIPGLPAGIPWTVRAGLFGYELTDVVVISTAGQTVDVEVSLAPGFADDFDYDQAWQFGAPGDDATDGLWERNIPFGSYFLGIVGPDMDATPTGLGYALLTERQPPGSFVGASDVDNGRTTVLSPVFDATGLGDLWVTYRRWFSNRAPEQGDDEFRADVSTDGGASWINLETVALGTDSWAEVAVDLSALLTPTSTMQFRFVAEDINEPQYVEAGIDDLQILTGATDASVLAGVVASRLTLSAPVPNPFRGRSELRFEVPRSGAASLEIYDVSGRRVATLLAAERLAAGRHSVAWTGRDASGRAVAPGVYFAKLVAAGETQTRKITLLR